MDVIIDNRKNCFNLTEGQFVSEWVDNTTSTEIIEMMPFPLLPHNFYKILNDTHYQWCGTMLLIAEYFAKFSKTKYSILVTLLFNHID